MKAIPKVFLLLGPEHGEKKLFINEIIETAKKSLPEPPEIFRFYPFETDISKAISILRNGSLFAPYRFILLMDCHEYTKSDTALIKEYLKSPSKEASLFLLSPHIQVDRGIMSAVPKNEQKIFWELFENQKKERVIRFFKSKEMTITSGALNLFLDLVENTTEEMLNSCEGLASFLGPHNEITIEQVEEFIFHSKEENVFTLFEKIAHADFQGSLEILNKIILSGEGYPVQILGGLLWQFRRLLEFLQLMETHHRPEDGFQKVNIRGKRNQRTYLAGIKNYTTPELKQIIVLIAEWDTKARETRADLHVLLLELFLYYTIRRKGAVQPLPALPYPI